MEIQYYGANAIKITTKKMVAIVDPVSDITDLQVDVKKADIVMATQNSLKPSVTDKSFVIDGPGEYEFEDISVKGVAAQAHIAASGDKSATMYAVHAGEMRILITGHINEKLSEDQLESIGVVDILVVPVGGGGYTLDATGAAAITKAIEPKLIIPVHAKDDGFNYEVPQSETDLFVKELGVPLSEEATDKLKVKSLPEQMTVQILQKS